VREPGGIHEEADTKPCVWAANLPLQHDHVGAPNWLNMPIGLININYVASTDPRTEANIVTGKWGYGRQLGRIADALETLINELKNSHPEMQQNPAVQEFQQMAGEIKILRGPASDEDDLYRTVLEFQRQG